MTTHILSIKEARARFDHIQPEDPQEIPLTYLVTTKRGNVYQINEDDLGADVAMRQRLSMIQYWSEQGRRDEIRAILQNNGMRINEWALPAGATITEVRYD